MHNFYRGFQKPKNRCYFLKFRKKLPKGNNHPIGENSSNLVTLGGGNIFRVVSRFCRSAGDRLNVEAAIVERPTMLCLS
jgi:hypothetical protein